MHDYEPRRFGHFHDRFNYGYEGTFYLNLPPNPEPNPVHAGKIQAPPELRASFPRGALPKTGARR